MMNDKIVIGVQKSVAENPNEKSKVKVVFKIQQKTLAKVAAAIGVIIVASSAIGNTVSHKMAVNEALDNSADSIAISAIIDEGRESGHSWKYDDVVFVNFSGVSTSNVAYHIATKSENIHAGIFRAYRRYKKESCFDDEELKVLMDRLMAALKEKTKDSENPFPYETFDEYVIACGCVDEKEKPSYSAWNLQMEHTIIDLREAEKRLDEMDVGGRS